MIVGAGGLADFCDANHLYDGGLFLSLCKAIGLGLDRVRAGKLLPILVKQCDLPVMVLSALVFPERFPFPTFHFPKSYHVPQLGDKQERCVQSPSRKDHSTLVLIHGKLSIKFKGNGRRPDSWD